MRRCGLGDPHPGCPAAPPSGSAPTPRGPRAPAHGAPKRLTEAAVRLGIAIYSHQKIRAARPRPSRGPPDTRRTGARRGRRREAPNGGGPRVRLGFAIKREKAEYTSHGNVKVHTPESVPSDTFSDTFPAPGCWGHRAENSKHYNSTKQRTWLAIVPHVDLRPCRHGFSAIQFLLGTHLKSPSRTQPGWQSFKKPGLQATPLMLTAGGGTPL